MSYILDALRKAEREKKRSSVPQVLEEQRVPPPKRTRKGMMTTMIVAGLLSMALVSGIGVGIWYAKKREISFARAPQTSAKSSPQQSSVEMERSRDVRVGESVVEADSLIEEGRKRHVAGSSDDGARDSEVGRKDRGKDSVSAIPSARTDSSVPNEQQEELPPPDPNRLYALHELPISVREKLPQFTFSVFLYADEPAERRVRVNGNTMKEGQYLSEGLKLEEILSDGVVFRYHDYRFRIALR